MGGGGDGDDAISANESRSPKRNGNDGRCLPFTGPSSLLGTSDRHGSGVET